MKLYDDFFKQLGIVLDMLLERIEKEPERLVLKTLYSHYKKASEVIEANGNLNDIRIKGSMRAYLDSYSDYMNPILQEMGKAEKMLDSILAGKKDAQVNP